MSVETGAGGYAFGPSNARRPGDAVSAGGDALGSLDASELKLELAQAQAEQMQQLKKAAVCRRDGRIGEAQMAQAAADQATARIGLAEHRIRQSTITSPIDGVIVRGNLDNRCGTRLKMGEVLFEVAQLNSLYADILLPESDMPDVVIGQAGELATTAFPEQKIPFVVASIEPAARSDGPHNVFRARARLTVTPDWLRPGMRGAARIAVEKTSYLDAWTRRFVNWVRMEFWL